MLRNLMRVAALLAALCALGVLTTAPAMAAEGEFTIGTAPAAITAEQKSQEVIAVHTISGIPISLKCSVATFEGTSSTTSGKDLTLTPTYSGCTFGGLAATVKMNGCKYTFTGSAAQTATVDVTGCTTGKTITITKGNCTIAIGEQSSLSHVIFISEGTGSTMDLLAQETVSGIKSTQTGSECPAPGSTQSDGTYSGTTTFRAFSDTGSRSVTKHEHTYSEVICGTQTSFTID